MAKILPILGILGISPTLYVDPLLVSDFSLKSRQGRTLIFGMQPNINQSRRNMKKKWGYPNPPPPKKKKIKSKSKSIPQLNQAEHQLQLRRIFVSTDTIYTLLFTLFTYTNKIQTRMALKGIWNHSTFETCVILKINLIISSYDY